MFQPPELGHNIRIHGQNQAARPFGPEMDSGLHYRRFTSTEGESLRAI